MSGDIVPKLTDSHGRRITYLRLAITDRCNLRCRYCMPKQGIEFLPHKDILTFEEMLRLVKLLTSVGVSKVRITGGEPFVRKGCINFLHSLKELGVNALHLTSNGIAIDNITELATIGINGINLSLDTISRKRFYYLTRRDYLPKVWKTFHAILAHKISLKINSVVQEDTSDEEIIEMAKLAHNYNIHVRFIEKMAFGGNHVTSTAKFGQLRERLLSLFPTITEATQDFTSTARQFYIPGTNGSICIIEGYSRRFCTHCNKIRITAQGMLKTCLYDNGVLDLRAMLRSGVSDDKLLVKIRTAIARRLADGLETEANNHCSLKPSMASIGG